MKLLVERSMMKIVPESPVDEAYIEEVLCLKENGGVAECRRIDLASLSGIAYVRINRAEKRE